MKFDFVVHTYGCKVNTYDSGLLENRLKKFSDSTPALNLSSSSEGKAGDPATRVHILNTCAVTQEASKEAVRQIRRIKSKEPLATVVVTGCAAQVDGGMFDHLPSADLIVANSHKGQLEEILEKHYKGQLKEKVFRSNIFKKEDLEAGGGLKDDHTRSFLKIQDGCNSFCTYCVIPFARGKSRSISVRDLVQKVQSLSDQGVAEVVLTGIHIGDYESKSAGDKKEYLEDLVEAVLKQTTISRLRLTSLEPQELTPRLLDLYSDPRLCPHFHMSIQSATTKILRDMKRKYTAEEVEDSLNRIADKLPRNFVGLDVIAGFPGETDEEFEETYQRLSRLPWTKLHVFPYSERPGTKAALRTDQIYPHERHRRAGLLRHLSDDRYRKLASQQVGEVKNVLVLNRVRNGLRESLSQDFWPILIPENLVRPGEETSVRITGDGYGLGELQLAETSKHFLLGSVLT